MKITSDYKIGFAGTDGRTYLSAQVVSTAKSEVESGRYKGIIVRGTSGQPEFQKKLGHPIDFIPTEDNSVEAYFQATLKALKNGELDCVVPMPEDLLFEGFVDRLIEVGYGDKVIGLTSKAARLEGDKIWTKYYCDEFKIPVADKWFKVDAKNFEKIRKICISLVQDYGGAVLKYPYSAGGKGARLIQKIFDIKPVYDQLIRDYKSNYKRIHRNKEWPLLIESLMSGVEISFTILVDRYGRFRMLPTAMDYPERYAAARGTQNPITGGMGSISPHPFESLRLRKMVKEQIAMPLIQFLKEKDHLRPCVLYPGCFVKIDDKGRPSSVQVSEINIRPGEPEWQPMIKRIRNLGSLFQGAVEGNFDIVRPEIRNSQISICVALVVGPGGPDGQRGYPGSYTKGEPLEIDFDYFQKKGIQVVPSGVGYSKEKGFFSDGTRVVYLVSNATIKEERSEGEVVQELQQKIKNAFINAKVRVVPREDSKGNRLNKRDDIGDEFRKVEELFNS